uniref:Uncharacterized protein n=1 Tax=Amphora coffeiformis TaxID=265554 RepID=A0A7S3L9S1_9STRA|mmetsp:Transcript_18363/g.35094  ORF Transcript_18363/g.35094 Transcript_18363/m.35094 type:complete len:162 (+) Transcript_18363:1492-1977(+)|eukprot:scaffold1982_cov93-Amphora_coffeaeformis.AAC.5
MDQQEEAKFITTAKRLLFWDAYDAYTNRTSTTTDNSSGYHDDYTTGDYVIALFPWVLSMLLLLAIVCVSARNSTLPYASDGRTVCTSVDEEDEDDGKESADVEEGTCSPRHPPGSNDAESPSPEPKQDIGVVVVVTTKTPPPRRTRSSCSSSFGGESRPSS